ncbi:MAG: hypothetical protein KJZ84_22430 [Bryobacteraceae bacterium]|nr:hypothetical protein [Bryobacteraceae bacterium]
MAAAAVDAGWLKLENDAQRAAQQAELDRATADRARAEADKAQLRADLLRQFNAVLETQDTARGLIVNMADVLFDTGKFIGVDLPFLEGDALDGHAGELAFVEEEDLRPRLFGGLLDAAAGEGALGRISGVVADHDAAGDGFEAHLDEGVVTAGLRSAFLR